LISHFKYGEGYFTFLTKYFSQELKEGNANIIEKFGASGLGWFIWLAYPHGSLFLSLNTIGLQLG
jgi:hypothetical protein